MEHRVCAWRNVSADDQRSRCRRHCYRTRHSVEATTANGMLQAGATTSQKIMSIPAATTATFPLGNGRFDFEIEWAGGIVRRYVSGSLAQVNPEVGDA